MKNAHERLRKLSTRNTRPFALASAALPAFSSFLLFFLVLIFNVEFGLAQGPPSEPRQNEVASPRFRVERTTVAGGGELLTFWARVIDDSNTESMTSESQAGSQLRTEELPLMSVLRDTLGDANRENDVLREVWVHTYVRPKLVQQAAAFVPFLYRGLRVEPRVSLTSPPRAIINLSETSQPVWRRLVVAGITSMLVDQPLLKASVHNYQRNVRDYRKSNLARALTILSLYESQPQTDSPFNEAELVQMQSQLALKEKTFGGLVDQIHFSKFHENQGVTLRDLRGHNWELLRQQAEASGLYFEPLSLADRTATHALLWFPSEDAANKDSPQHPFEGRFLNIKNPWRDKRLARWEGYTETKHFNLENQTGSDGNSTGPNNRPVTMIPLALYGLDFEKIPALLIDFRDSGNPRRRELSGRLINDITRDLLSLSKFGNVYYFLARSSFDFVTSRRGIDVNQPSRLRSAAELKLLLSFNPNISPALREELNHGLDNLSINPLENGGKTERELAFAQYRALQAYALRADGLAARLDRQRGAELSKSMHRGLDGKLMRLANIITLGRYTHREKLTPELRQQLDKERQLAYHTRFLKQVARSTPIAEVTSNMDEVLASLRYISENGSEKDKDAAKVVGAIFSRTEDVQAKDLSLSALKKIGNKVATKELSRIYHDRTVAVEWRTACAEYLKIEPPPRSKTAEVSVGAQLNTSQQP